VPRANHNAIDKYERHNTKHRLSANAIVWRRYALYGVPSSFNTVVVAIWFRQLRWVDVRDSVSARDPLLLLLQPHDGQSNLRLHLARLCKICAQFISGISIVTVHVFFSFSHFPFSITCW